MKGSVIGHAANAMVFVGIVGAFKVYIAFYQRGDHLRGILKVHIVIGCTVYNQVFPFYLIGVVDG